MEHVNQIPRPGELDRIRAGLAHWPVTIVFGPRQIGKTTLVRDFATSPDHYFDLHQPVDRVRLEESQFRILDGLDGVVVMDEAQEMPALFQKLRALADRRDRQTRFILTGSTSPRIFHGASESLTGRVRLHSLGGFSLSEVGPGDWNRLWIRGGFPAAYCRELEAVSMEIRQNYIAQVLTRDLPALTELRLTSEQTYRFFRLLAHYHGQYWNHARVAALLGVNNRTIQRYVELFKGIYLVRELPPYFHNAAKRLRRAPKLYLRDTGLLHALLNIRTEAQLTCTPHIGASWEGFGIEQIACLFQIREEEMFTWSVQSGAEVDLVLPRPGGLIGFEFKSGDAPRRTRSMTAAIQALQLRKLYMVYPGEKDYAIDDVVQAVGIRNLHRLPDLGGDSPASRLLHPENQAGPEI
ncbi:MAG: ATP-binding protein [Verrucomicrobiae bacterium]|nr:ATP-binding protein [Verrucomicrobiae bacterium]